MTKLERKKFYKAIWKFYGIEQPNPKGNYITNKPEYYRQVYIFLKAYTIVRGFNYVGLAEAKKLHKKYWERFHKVYGERAKRNGGWPKMKPTEAIKELIDRGFVYCTEAEIDFEKKYCVISHIGGLVWPKDFESHQDAIQCMEDFGIPSYTGTKLPKKS